MVKILSDRLFGVMDKLVSPNHSIFLKIRLLVYEVIIVNEFVDLAKMVKKSFLVFKVDFNKAYDSGNWSFLDYMLSRFDFNDKWRGWICTCVFSSNLAILVYGFPTQETIIQMGLKQGDPMYPFLFLFVAKDLSGLFSRDVNL